MVKLSSSYHLVYSQKIQHHRHQPQAGPGAGTQEQPSDTQWWGLASYRWWVLKACILPWSQWGTLHASQNCFQWLGTECEEWGARGESWDKYEPSRAPSFNTKVTRRICHHLKSKLEQQGSNVSIFSGLILHFKSILPCWITKSQNYPQ